MTALLMRARHVDACGALCRLTGTGCCTSCTEDDEMGVPICEIESPSGRHWSSVCCVHERMEPEDEPARRAWWAVLLQEARR